MKVISVLLLVAAVSATSNEELSRLLGYNGLNGKDCDSSLNGVTVIACDVTPFPPHKGDNVDISAQAKANIPFNFKSLDVFIKWNGITILTQTFPQSGSYNVGDTAAVKFTINFPSISPGGSYEVDAKVKNDKDEYLNCWAVNFSV